MSVKSFYSAALLLLLPGTVPALDINLNPSAGMSQESIDGFQRAADYWESVLVDNVTINIDINFTALNPGVLGQASSNSIQPTIANYFVALGGDATSADDATSVANLPMLSAGFNGLSHMTQVNTEGNSTAITLDNDNSNNNRFLDLNRANAKAVGLLAANDAGTDASITFSTGFTWDFDNSDGVDAGHQDFVGVAVHEIGHALGFNSGVDLVDAAIDGIPGATAPFDQPFDIDGFAVYTGLDMFRYTAAGVHNLGAGAAAYFSIDGGTTNLALFSTGRNNGDGQQASHWKDNMGLGIFDPTANPAGQTNPVSALDLQSLDVIGWDLAAVVPEPSSLTMLIGSTFVFWIRRRRS